MVGDPTDLVGDPKDLVGDPGGSLVEKCVDAEEKETSGAFRLRCIRVVCVTRSEAIGWVGRERIGVAVSWGW